MVKKYIILADSSVGFETPKQLTKINGETIIKRTIRLLKENGINDIIITSHDKRFDNLGAIRYEPKNNYYIPDYSDYKNNKGYWLNAFPVELLNEPITFLFGDVYYSENAIKKIVETDTNSTLFFCSYCNSDIDYIKNCDEPLAYKVVDYELFKEHIEKVKQAKDKGLCCREPIVWELYRSINNQELNIHKMSCNYIAINDISCDIDTKKDIKKLERKIIGGEKMVRLETIEEFTLQDFGKLKDIVRKGKDTEGRLFVGDTFVCDENMQYYLLGNNALNKTVAKVIEVIPEKKEEPKEEVKEEPEKEMVINKPKTRKPRKTKK